MPKLLSPVTSFEAAIKVISAGADEIYCGVKIPGVMHTLNRPEWCCVSTYEELRRIVNHAHSKGVETIVTVELPFMAHFIEKEIKKHISSCVKEGIDALIVGDLGILTITKDMDLSIPVYASTFLGAMNYETVDFLGKMGVRRVILERHTRIEEIREVVQRNKDVEIEVFVHGPGCSNINANCYLEFVRAAPDVLEAVFNGIKGVPTPCRIPFDIYEVGSDGRKIARAPILDAYTFCSLCQLTELIETGITGLKIVGRCLPPTYQVQTTKMYRKLIDLIDRGQIKLFNKMLKDFKEETFEWGLRYPKSLLCAPPCLGEVFCREKRCYYSSFFQVPNLKI